MKRLTEVPQPALVRSALVAISGVVAYLLGRQVDTAWVDSVVTLYALAAPMLAGLLIRPAVTPVARLRTNRQRPFAAWRDGDAERGEDTL